MLLYVSSTCAHHQEVKITLHSHWYHHIYCDRLVHETAIYLVVIAIGSIIYSAEYGGQYQ